MTFLRSSHWALALAAPLLAAPAAAQTHPEALQARSLAATCANCHGTAGVAKGAMPSLAGRSEAELVKLLTNFRNGTQPATVMHQIAKGYTEEQLKLVSKHFAALPAAKP